MSGDTWTPTIRYTVPAATKLEAIEAAVAKLRSTVRLIGVVSAAPVPTVGELRPYWVVRLRVSEDV